MKAVKLHLDDKTAYLALTGEAMFQIRDKFGSTNALLETIEQDTREGFRASCSAAAILAEQGELLRRRLGYQAAEIPGKDDFLLMTMPFKVVDLKNAVIRAIALGFGREVEDDEIDVGLAELNAQKKNVIRRADYYRAATLSGLTATEALYFPPGEVFDMWELYLRAHGEKGAD